MSWDDDQLRKLWTTAGGRFHGPNVETGTMPEALLLPFLRRLLGGNVVYIAPTPAPKPKVPVALSPEAYQLLDQTESSELPKAYAVMIKRAADNLELLDPVNHAGSDTHHFTADFTLLTLKMTYRYVDGTIYVDKLEVTS
jgi:hypothetical protein